MTTLKVAILGATGETGSSIVKGLLNSTETRYEITALTRPSSLQKPAVQELQQQGVKAVAIDLGSPEAEIAEKLRGMDVVISAIDAAHLRDQIPLANACKVAGVGRFVPCCFATVAPPKGVLVLRDIKEDVLNHIKKIRLPYTAIDVGWWYQTTLPRLPSGRIDYAMPPNEQFIAGDGNTPYALTDIGDIGMYTARIIADPRTLNHMVFAYNEIKTQNQVYDLIEKLSGEKVERNHIPVEKIQEGVAEAEAKDIEPGRPDFFRLAIFQYWNTWGIRGDNTPEYARYLGYLIAKDLYPGLEGKPYKKYCEETLEGKSHAVYKGMSFTD
ncbi:hypothetical protein CEP52_005571 [Fusarium oligoseptatum]|uniref:NmrA-like domain-containing protein n=1 Tax=Fusarium oligoseptatum TaxID=2604345 RepID=A0A428TXH3_9HYPO|nr:hypothetical protein CEP52_005571 [Fusarium oligoseptatum]